MHKLLKRKESRKECILHNLRSYVYAVLFFFVSQVHFSGFYIFIPLFVLLFDVVISVMDILEEPKSRSYSNGLSRQEYLLHMILSFGLGIFYFIYISILYTNFQSAPGIEVYSGSQSLLQIGLLFSAGVSLLMGFYYTYQLKSKTIN